MRITSQGVCPKECHLGGREVTASPVELTERVVGLGGRTWLVGRQLVAGRPELAFRLFPRTAKTQDLAAMDPADPVEGRGRGQGSAPCASGVGPFGPATDVGDLAALGDERAVHRTGKVVVELAAEHQRHRLI